MSRKSSLEIGTRKHFHTCRGIKIWFSWHVAHTQGRLWKSDCVKMVTWAIAKPSACSIKKLSGLLQSLSLGTKGSAGRVPWKSLSLWTLCWVFVNVHLMIVMYVCLNVCRLGSCCLCIVYPWSAIWKCFNDGANYFGVSATWSLLQGTDIDTFTVKHVYHEYYFDCSWIWASIHCTRYSLLLGYQINNDIYV